MAIVEVKVPQLSESVAEATLLQWKKRPGEAVALDEILIEIETDKVVLEVPAPGRRARRMLSTTAATPSSPSNRSRASTPRQPPVPPPAWRIGARQRAPRRPPRRRRRPRPAAARPAWPCRRRPS
jgi:2-oxoglutarate dehydrogenase E2 component (dihydrolipoamide succinyltransferase)